MSKKTKKRLEKQFPNYNPDRKNVFYHSEHDIKEQLPTIVWTTNKNLVFTSCYGSGLNIVGLKKDEAIGMSLSEFHGDTATADSSIANHNKALNGESVTYFVEWKGHQFLGNVHPSYDSKGNIDGCIGISIDVTSIIEDEKNLKESESIFRQLAQSTNALIFIYQNNFTIWANPTAQEFTGYSLEELLQMESLDLVHPDMKEIVKQRAKDRIAGKQIISRYEVKILTKDKKVKWFDYSGAQIIYNNEPAIMGTGLDITERKVAEAALRTSEKNYRSIVDTAQEGIWRIDKDANTDFANEHMAKMLGYTIKEMMGKSMYYFMDELGIEQANRNFERRKKGISEEHEFRFMKKDGSDIWVLMSTNPSTDEDGTFSGALAMVVDITERKKTEEKLRAATNLLQTDKKELKEQNIALKKVLDHIELDKKEYQHKMCEKLDMAIIPILERLKAKADPKQVKEIEIVESNVKAILNQDMDISKGLFERLTPRELDICQQVKSGKSSKEISSNLNISVVTIHKHREKIRKKLGLTNQNLNLVAFLRLHDHTH